MTSLRPPRKYKRASDGKFATVAGSGAKKGAPLTVAKTAVKATQGSIGKKVGGLLGARQRQVRRERNQTALQNLKAQGLTFPKGTMKRIAQLKKGQSIKLANGMTIRRTKTNSYKYIK